MTSSRSANVRRSSLRSKVKSDHYEPPRRTHRMADDFIAAFPEMRRLYLRAIAPPKPAGRPKQGSTYSAKAAAFNPTEE